MMKLQVHRARLLTELREKAAQSEEILARIRWYNAQINLIHLAESKLRTECYQIRHELAAMKKRGKLK